MLKYSWGQRCAIHGLSQAPKQTNRTRAHVAHRFHSSCNVLDSADSWPQLWGYTPPHGATCVCFLKINQKLDSESLEKPRFFNSNTIRDHAKSIGHCSTLLFMLFSHLLLSRPTRRSPRPAGFGPRAQPSSAPARGPALAASWSYGGAVNRQHGIDVMNSNKNGTSCLDPWSR